MDNPLGFVEFLLNLHPAQGSKLIYLLPSVMDAELDKIQKMRIFLGICTHYETGIMSI